ncbi:hypothetical protein ACMFMG_012126 [Clarireedia jacksonii]
MSLKLIVDEFLASLNSSAVEQNSTQFPDRLIESIIPGYRSLHRFILQSLNFDITIIFPVLAAVWTAWKGFRFIYSWAQIFIARIQIAKSDVIHPAFLEWMASQPAFSSCQVLIAETNYQTRDAVTVGDGHLPNFSHQQFRTPPKYSLGYTIHHLWFEGRRFAVIRNQGELTNMRGDQRIDEKLTIECHGRSTQPIQHLLETVQKFKISNTEALLPVLVPKLSRRSPFFTLWEVSTMLRYRPKNSLALEKGILVGLIDDAADFLKNRTWYEQRGIPYQRGYLFYGPPGNGKSSFAFYLATTFGLNIYVINLGSQNLTDDDLTELFSALSDRCVVLLEDVDCAGRTRHPPVEEEKNEKPGISLSGLLNTINGIGAKEGRILIVTTNEPQKLDDALLRPGRIDRKYEFRNPTSEHIERLFLLMYATIEYPSEQALDGLKGYAKQFASRVPEGKYSFAELQGFMLQYKEKPAEACANVMKWIESEGRVFGA